MNDSRLTPREKTILQTTVVLWNAICKLEELHPQDREEACRDIHNIQNRIMARPELRAGKKEE